MKITVNVSVRVILVIVASQHRQNLLHFRVYIAICTHIVLCVTFQINVYPLFLSVNQSCFEVIWILA